MTKDRDAVLSALNVSRETADRLDAYAALLAKWNPRINLVAPKTIAELWSRHVLDSGQLVDYAPENLSLWTDLGSGGGFPGAVAAILLRERQPTAHVTLIESDQRKAAFLRAVARETDTTFTVISERIEAITPQMADIVTARALAPLPKLLELVSRHLHPDGRALLQKGAGHQAEVANALERWRFDCKTHRSKTDEEAVILEIEGLERV